MIRLISGNGMAGLGTENAIHRTGRISSPVQRALDIGNHVRTRHGSHHGPIGSGP